MYRPQDVSVHKFFDDPMLLELAKQDSLKPAYPTERVRLSCDSHASEDAELSSYF